MQVAADNRDAELGGRIMHPLNHLSVDPVFFDIEKTSTIAMGFPAHCGNIMDIDEHRAVSGPVRVGLHEPAPDTVSRKKKRLAVVLDHCRVLTK